MGLTSGVGKQPVKFPTIKLPVVQLQPRTANTVGGTTRTTVSNTVGTWLANLFKRR